MAEGVQDLLALDRDVARGAAALEQWREAMARHPESLGDEAPLEAVRHVAGKSTWDALGETTPSAADVPLRDALRQWVVALTQGRIGAPAEAARARAAAVPQRVELDRPHSVTWREAWRGVVGAASVAEAKLYLDAAASAGEGMADAARVGAARRLEVARRFGLGHPWVALVGVGANEVRQTARDLLDATEAIARHAWDDLWGKPGVTAAATIFGSLARDAGEGWPAHLTARWIGEALGADAVRALAGAAPSLPPVAGAASFARALGAFGRAFVMAGARRMPFALAQEPAAVAAHRWAFVFSALPASPEWQARILGVGRRTAVAQARLLARSALLDVRLHAARLLLGDEAAFAPQDLFDELGSRVFGVPLDGRLRGAWPAARHDEPGRFVALLQAPEAMRELVERFDVDWFRNPRAWEELRGRADAPARGPIDAKAFGAQVATLKRSFEEALG
jgi:hypothetical protein